MGGEVIVTRPGGVPRILSAALLAVLSFLAASPAVQAQQDEISNEYRVTLFPFHPIRENLTGFGYLGYVKNPDGDFQSYYLGWPGLNYSFRSWLQIWGGLIGIYTDSESAANKLELRPFTGVKLFVPNEAKINVYNFTRFEFRDTKDLETHRWSAVGRARSRFGVEAPLAPRVRGWQPGTWYGLADVEAFYQAGKDAWDPVRVRFGPAYIVNDRLRIEAIYHVQYTREQPGASLDHTDNIFRLNVKIGLTHGIIQSLSNPDADD